MIAPSSVWFPSKWSNLALPVFLQTNLVIVKLVVSVPFMVPRLSRVKIIMCQDYHEAVYQDEWIFEITAHKITVEISTSDGISLRTEFGGSSSIWTAIWEREGGSCCASAVDPLGRPTWLLCVHKRKTVPILSFTWSETVERICSASKANCLLLWLTRAAMTPFQKCLRWWLRPRRRTGVKEVN